MNTNHDEETTPPAAGKHAAMSLRQQSNTDRSSDKSYQEGSMVKDHGHIWHGPTLGQDQAPRSSRNYGLTDKDQCRVGSTWETPQHLKQVPVTAEGNDQNWKFLAAEDQGTAGVPIGGHVPPQGGEETEDDEDDARRGQLSGALHPNVTLRAPARKFYTPRQLIKAVSQ